MSATQIGKTTACALWLLARAWVQPGSLNWWAAPTYKDTDTGFERLVRFAQTAGIYVSHNVTKRLLWLTNGSVIEARSWERPETIGAATVHNMVVDEAGELTVLAWAKLAARRSATLGPVRFIGNPGATGSAFWQICQQTIEREGAGDPGVRFIQWTWRDRARCLPQAAREAYVRFVEQQKRDLPPSEYRQLYEAEWGTPDDAIFGEVIDELFSVERDATPHRGHSYIVGWDIGIERDNTVGAPLCLTCFTIADIIVAPRGLASRLKDFIADNTKRWNGATGVIETNGPGGPMFHEVTALWPRTQKWWTDNTSKRSAVFELLRRARNAALTICNDKATVQEFRTFRSQQSKSGLWTFAGQKGGKDDRVMACLIAVGAATSGAAAMLEMMRDQLATPPASPKDEGR